MICLHGNRGWRHSRQQHLPGRISPRKSVIQTHVLHESWRVGVKKFDTGSSCLSRLAPQPIPESALLTGDRATNDAYAVAKLPTSILSGVSKTERIQLHRGDADQPLRASATSIRSTHTSSALIRPFTRPSETPPEVTVWGSGTPRLDSCTVMTLPKPACF